MSTAILAPDDARPSGKSAGRFAAFVTVLLLLLGGLFIPAQPAHAAIEGVGYWSGPSFLGGYETGVDGRQAFCADLWADPPYGNTSGPQRVTEWDSLSRQQLAELNYVLDRWGQIRDPQISAAVALFVWSVASPTQYNSHGMSGDDFYVAIAPAANRPAILANLATMRQQASANAITDPAVALSLTMSDQYAGSLTVSAHPASLTGPVTLTNGVFADGTTTRTLGAGTHSITGTPEEGAPSYRVAASMSVDAAGYGAALDFYATPGKQRLIAAVAGSTASLSARAESPVIDLDFQPEIETQVAAKFVQAGDPFVDQLAVSVTKHSWIKLDGTPVPVLAEGRLYGPFDAQPAEANAPPSGAPLLGTEELTLTHPGTYSSPGTLIAPESGFYTWVWSIDKSKQGEVARYLTDSFTDRFGRITETSITPFQPEAVSRADGKLVKPSDEVTDTITVSSTNGMWLKQNGDFIPVIFEGTAYQVPGTLPPAQGATVPADAVPLGTVSVTATGPGTYTSPKVTLPQGGFVTWVWQITKTTQPEWVRPFIAADWQDDYGINVETHSVRWPLTITSEVREYNVHKGGRAFDRITVTGFPDNHPEFAGDGYWAPDEQEVTHTVYGPFASEEELTDDLDLATAPILKTITTPAKNGVYDIGYTDADRIEPTKAGYYVIVTTFVGDDRVQPFQSSPTDIWERFFVPEDGQPVSVITQATPAALVGEPFEDTALVQGTEIPDDAYLVFRAYGPQPADDAPVCGVEFFTSEKIPVAQAGVYRSGTTSVDAPGNVYWVETLYGENDTILSEGICGAPGETTVVTDGPATPETPTSPLEVPELPELPTTLAVTGGSDFGLIIGIGAAVALLAAGVTLWFGRRLALYRERNNNEGKENHELEDLLND